MAHTLRYVPSPGQTVLVSVRCFQARFLLRPSERVNKLILGVLAKAQEKYQVPVFAPTFLSNHGHLLAWFRDAEHQAKFMHYVDGNIAREVGRLHRWKGKFWGQPFSSSLVAHDEASQVTILRYVLEQACKEGLVARPRDWPGVHAASILLSGRNPKGIWVDRTALYEARRRKKNRGKVRAIDFEEEVELKISQLPCWADLSAAEYVERIAAMVSEIEARTSARLETDSGRVLGRRGILRQNPHHQPPSAKRGSSPIVLAASRKLREVYIEAYRIFVRAYRSAAESLKAGNLTVDFPDGCFPPARPFVRVHGPP